MCEENFVPSWTFSSFFSKSDTSTPERTQRVALRALKAPPNVAESLAPAIPISYSSSTAFPNPSRFLGAADAHIMRAIHTACVRYTGGGRLISGAHGPTEIGFSDRNAVQRRRRWGYTSIAVPKRLADVSVGLATHRFVGTVPKIVTRRCMFSETCSDTKQPTLES